MALALGITAGCGAPDGGEGTHLRMALPPDAVYLGAEAEALDAEIIRITARMQGARDDRDVRDYALCALAGYADARGHAFARHLRTTVDKTGGVWQADAVYTISPAIPQGVRTIDVEAQLGACVETGIPQL
ncbi:hypothetical protein ACRDNQ_02960 [Palleronia sp. KMU-117]|uniref:hypothetical protein n=1 Tax=Palleronia sp. KMU-117 TaxID=3434108 RepID=UPI003D709006